jgi:AAA15 family ATPase/GTPase
MAIYIEELHIKSFRGIHHLAVNNLNHINIIAGDNNSGKTSVLEVMLMLRNPKDFANILRIARQRDMGLFLSGASTYENFINLFPKNQESLDIGVKAICKNQSVKINLFGEQKVIFLEPEEINKGTPLTVRNQVQLNLNQTSMEAEGFKGKLQYQIGSEQSENSVEIHSYSSISGREINRNNYLNMIYLAPFDHMRGNILNRILSNDSYKEVCLHILQLFSPEIIDLLILKNEDNNRPVEYVKHSTLGNMPLSTYGDGIKKVLSLANGIAQAAGGILLIDEIETAIHSKYYNDIFTFIVKACKQFKVQAFITTHSIEAIDGFLATQNYSNQDQMDDISILTFKKDVASKKTYSRVLSGRHVYSNREQFGFEVRI